MIENELNELTERAKRIWNAYACNIRCDSWNHGGSDIASCTWEVSVFDSYAKKHTTHSCREVIKCDTLAELRSKIDYYDLLLRRL